MRATWHVQCRGHGQKWGDNLAAFPHVTRAEPLTVCISWVPGTQVEAISLPAYVQPAAREPLQLMRSLPGALHPAGVPPLLHVLQNEFAYQLLF